MRKFRVEKSKSGALFGYHVWFLTVNAAMPAPELNS
jgi:hypothetical protein